MAGVNSGNWKLSSKASNRDDFSKQLRSRNSEDDLIETFLRREIRWKTNRHLFLRKVNYVNFRFVAVLNLMELFFVSWRDELFHNHLLNWVRKRLKIQVFIQKIMFLTEKSKFSKQIKLLQKKFQVFIEKNQVLTDTSKFS